MLVFLEIFLGGGKYSQLQQQFKVTFCNEAQQIVFNFNKLNERFNLVSTHNITYKGDTKTENHILV